MQTKLFGVLVSVFFMLISFNVFGSERCAIDNDCSGKLICVNSQCVDPRSLSKKKKLCRIDDECPGKQLCHKGACISPRKITNKTRCRYNDECPYGHSCLNGGCIRTYSEPPAEKAKNERELYFMVYGTLLPWGQQEAEFTGDGGSLSLSSDMEFSGGLGMVIENRVANFVSVGGSLQYLFGIGEGLDLDQHNGWLQLAPTLRFLYNGKIVEPYVRINFGFTLMIPTGDDVKDTIDPGPGFHIAFTPGIMLKKDGFGCFIELGIIHARAYPEVSDLPDDVDVNFSLTALMLNFGVGGLF